MCRQCVHNRVWPTVAALVLGLALVAGPVGGSNGAAAARAAGTRVRTCRAASAVRRTLLGDTKLESRRGASPAGVLTAFPARGSATGRATALCVYVDRRSRAKRLTAGLYTDRVGHPRARLVEGSLTKLRRGAWNVVRLPATTLRDRARYWIVLRAIGGSVVTRERRSATCHAMRSPRPRASLPSRWNGASRWGSCPVSGYVIGVPAERRAPAAPLPAPTPTPVAPGATPAPAGPALPACTLSMSPARSLDSVLHAAASGAVVCLSSGTYTSGLDLAGISPASSITIRPADGATVVFAGALSLSGTIERLTFSGFEAPSNLRGGVSIVGDGAADIAFTDDTFNGSGSPGQGQVALSNLRARSDVSLTDDTFIDVSPCADCGEGTIQINNTGADNDPDGVTIADDLISGGLADGIQWGGSESGTRVLDNEITGKLQASPSQCGAYGGNCPHTDALQFVSDSRDIVLRGNYLHGNTDSILQADGSNTDITVTDNVLAVSDATTRAVQVAGWRGGTFSHNTVNSLATWDCTHDDVCTSGVTLTDNIFQGGIGRGIQDAGGQFAVEDYNLTAACPDGGATGCGAHDIHGAPRYVGGSAPRTYAGWALAAGSPGRADASDGSDRGAHPSSDPPGPLGAGSSGSSDLSLRVVDAAAAIVAAIVRLAAGA